MGTAEKAQQFVDLRMNSGEPEVAEAAGFR
jgi:hypothetical protein